jgi:hypothetical protein
MALSPFASVQDHRVDVCLSPMEKYHVLPGHLCSHASLKLEPSILDLIIERHIRWKGLNAKWM